MYKMLDKLGNYIYIVGYRRWMGRRLTPHHGGREMTSQRDQYPATYHICIRTYEYGVPSRAQRLQFFDGTIAEGMSHSEAQKTAAELRGGRVELLHNEYSPPTYTVVQD